MELSWRAVFWYLLAICVRVGAVTDEDGIRRIPVRIHCYGQLATRMLRLTVLGSFGRIVYRWSVELDGLASTKPPVLKDDTAISRLGNAESVL